MNSHRSRLNLVFQIFRVFLRLGLTSFGGPVAHLGFFHDEFVVRRKWLDERHYADIVGLCQFLPGPASSQVGLSIGYERAGYLGAFAAWLGFTIPSAVLMTAFAFGISKWQAGAWIHGLKLAAVAIVAQAIIGMAQKLSRGPTRAALTIAVVAIMMILPSTLGQMISLALGALIGAVFLRDINVQKPSIEEPVRGKKFGAALIAIFFASLILLPLAATHSDSSALKKFDSFYRAGSLVFGGGHVVLPLLKAEVVDHGLVSEDVFLAGYGAAQAVPGPLFTFSAYLGAVSKNDPQGVAGAVLCLVAIFLPSFLLVLGVLPFWKTLRFSRQLQHALQGVNAAVVGLLIAAFYSLVYLSAIKEPRDFIIALIGFALLMIWKAPSWSVVILCAALAYQNVL